MDIRYTFIHMDVSEAVKEYTGKKILEKIDRFVTKPIDVHITFSVEKKAHKAHCSVRGGDGFNCEVEFVSEDMHASVDKMVDKLYAQLKKHKDILKHHKDHGSVRHMEQAETPAETIDASDVIRLERSRQGAGRS